MPTVASYFLLPGVRHLFYTGVEAEAITLTAAQVYLWTLRFMQLAVTPCFLTENNLQGVTAFTLLSSNTMFILITMALLTGPLGDNMERLQPFLYTSMPRSIQTDILTGKPFVGMFVLAIGMCMLFPLLFALPGFREKELSL